MPRRGGTPLDGSPDCGSAITVLAMISQFSSMMSPKFLLERLWMVLFKLILCGPAVLQTAAIFLLYQATLAAACRPCWRPVLASAGPRKRVMRKLTRC